MLSKCHRAEASDDFSTPSVSPAYLQEQYNADAETWSSEQAALQADLAALAAQTALKSLALDAMMRNSSRGAQGGGPITIGGPLWQQVCLLPLHKLTCP